MQKTILKFKSVGLLWKFKQAIEVYDMEINLQRCILACVCTEADVALAVTKFCAELLPEKTEE